MSSQSVAICILAKHYHDSTKRAIDSALRFELPVYLGLTHASPDACQDRPIQVFSVPWADDFAKAKNYFFTYVSEAFILWLDSDEELFAFPELDWAGIPEHIILHRMQYGQQYTPRLCVQMHRNHPHIFWKRKIHEYLDTDNSALRNTRFVSSLIIRHHGYDDEHVLLNKHERNLKIAESIPPEEHAYAENLIRLRHDTAKGQSNFIAWLNCYREAKSITKLPYHYTHYEYEPAMMLCMAGYARPVEECLKLNPIHILLQLTHLTYELVYLDHINSSKLQFLSECLTQGLYDPYEDFPHVLLGARPDTILAYAKNWSLQWSNKNDEMTLAKSASSVELMQMIFQQNQDVIQHSYHDDTLLLHELTKKILVLNSSGALVWQLLKNPISYHALIALLTHAFPKTVSLHKTIQTWLNQLYQAHLIQVVTHE